MYSRFLKTLAITGTITLTLLGGTITAKAMWESLEEGQRKMIREIHAEGVRRIGSSRLEEYRPSSVLQHTGNYGLSSCFNEALFPKIDAEVKSCTGCQSSITTAYFQTVVPQLQQQLAATLLEVDGLKDDVQRLKAELRAEREQK